MFRNTQMTCHAFLRTAPSQQVYSLNLLAHTITNMIHKTSPHLDSRCLVLDHFPFSHPPTPSTFALWSSRHLVTFHTPRRLSARLIHWFLLAIARTSARCTYYLVSSRLAINCFLHFPPDRRSHRSTWVDLMHFFTFQWQKKWVILSLSCSRNR